MASILRYFGRSTNSNNVPVEAKPTLASRENFTLPIKRNSMSTSEDEVNLSETSNSVAGSGSAIQWDYFDSIPDDLEIGKDPISLPEDCYYTPDGIMITEPSNIDFMQTDTAKKFGLEIDCENINKFDSQLLRTIRYGEMEKCSPDSIEPSEANLIEPSSIIEKNEIDNDDFTKLYLSQNINIDSDTDIPSKYFSANGDTCKSVDGNNPLIPNNYLRNYTIATVDSCFEDIDTPAQLPVLHKHPRVQHPIHLKDYDIDSLEGSQNGNLEVTEEESITQVIEASASQSQASQSQDKAFWSSRSSSTAREIKPHVTETTTLASDNTSAICDKEVQAINGLKSSVISKSFDKIDEASSDDTLVNCEDIDDDENQSRSKRVNTVRFSSENIFIPISRSNSSPDEVDGEPRRRRSRRSRSSRHSKNDDSTSSKEEKSSKSSSKSPTKTSPTKSEQYVEGGSKVKRSGSVRGEFQSAEYHDEDKPDSFSFEISQGEKLSLDMELLQSGNILRPSGTFVEEKVESDETCSLTSVTNSATSENEIQEVNEDKSENPTPPSIVKHQVARTRHTSSCGDIVKYEIKTRKGKSAKIRYDNFHIKKEDSNLVVNFNISDDLIEPSYNNLMTREIKKYASEPIALNHKHLNNSGENSSEIDIFIEAITKENSCECMNSMVDVREKRNNYLRGYCIENVQRYTRGNHPSSLPNLRHPALVNGTMGHDEFLQSCIQNGDVGNTNEITDDAILSSEKNFEEEKINAPIDHPEVQGSLQILGSHQVKKSRNPFLNNEDTPNNCCNGDQHNGSTTEIEKYLSVSFEIKQELREDDTAESIPLSNKICDFVNLIMEPNSTFSEYDSELTPLHDVTGDKEPETVSEPKSDFTIHKEKQALINAEILGSSRENGSSRIESSSFLSDCSSVANKNEQSHVTLTDHGRELCKDTCTCARSMKTLRPIGCISDDEFFIPISKEDTSIGDKKYCDDHLVAMQSSIQTPHEKSHGNPFRRDSLTQDSPNLRNYDPAQQSFFSSSLNGQDNELYDYDQTNPDDSMYTSRNSIDFLNGSQTFTNEISEEEKIMLKLEALHLKGKSLRDIIAKTVHKQNDLINDWKLSHLGENNIQAKIKKLREVQIRLESEEDYDEANLVNHQIKELMDQSDNYKYQHPLLDINFVELMKNYENLCARQKVEHSVMRKEYESIKQWFYAKNDTEVKSEEDKIYQVNSLLKDKRMKIERGIRFTHLNKQHLVKNEKILKDEMETLTRELIKEQQKLNEERDIIQGQIKELIAKLVPLQDKEEFLSTTVANTSNKIQSIVDEFQPRLDAIKIEVNAATQEQARLTIALDRIAAEEEKINLKSGEIATHREKNEEIITVIETNIEKIQKTTQMNEKEFFKLEKFIDFEGLILDVDGELMRTKEQLEEYQAKLKELTNKVLADEWEEKRLQRTLNDLETQIAEFQKLKQVLVKERNYEDAKMTYEEIRSLINEGEMLSCVAMKFNEGIKLQKNEIEKITTELSQTKKLFQEMELANDQCIVERLKKMNSEIDQMLNSNPESWCVGILQLQVFNNNNIIQDLSKKHRLLPGKVHGKIEAIKKSLEELESTMEVVIS